MVAKQPQGVEKEEVRQESGLRAFALENKLLLGLVLLFFGVLCSVVIYWVLTHQPPPPPPPFQQLR